MQRIATLDGRVVQIEKQVQQLDDAISAGLANADINHGADVEVPLVPPGSPTFPGWPAPPTPPGGGFTLLPPGGDPAIPINGRNLMVGGVVTLALFAFTGWLAFRYALARVSRLAGLSGTNASQVSQLQQSVDAIAVEVERISENQRYVTRLLNPQGEQVPVANSVIGRRD